MTETATQTFETVAQNAHGQRIARMGDRVVAVLLDSFLLFPLFWLAASSVAVIKGVFHGGDSTVVGGPALCDFALIGAIWIGFHLVAEKWFCGTPGKHVMGIVVLNGEKTQISLRQSTIRNLLRPVDAIGFYLLGFVVALLSKQRQRIGDIAAGTLVYEKADDTRRFAVVVWIVWLIAGAVADDVFLQIFR